MTRNDWNDEERKKVIAHHLCYGTDKIAQLSEVIDRHSTDSIKLELLRLHNYIIHDKMEITSATNVGDRAATIKKYKAVFEKMGLMLIKL